MEAMEVSEDSALVRTAAYQHPLMINTLTTRQDDEASRDDIEAASEAAEQATLPPSPTTSQIQSNIVNTTETSEEHAIISISYTKFFV
jgi:hypothetical protein